MSNITFRKVAIFQQHDILLFRLQNKIGSYAEVSNYGANLISFVIKDKHGKMNNIILGYPNIRSYFTDTFYMGSTIGRFANRIANAQFNLNDKVYYLDKNDGDNSNHGGYTGINSKVFSFDIQRDTLIFYLKSADGEGGFPGTIDFTVTYSFSDDNELHIEYQVRSTKKTIFNPTNHAYFNLSTIKGSIVNHELKIFADNYLETTPDFIPTGIILPVKNTAFDFRSYKFIRSMMSLKNEILPGFNTYFISNIKNKTKHLASLRESQSGITVDVFSTMPGLQIYTGDYLSTPHHPLSGICLEAQFYPDGPNHKHFETWVLQAGETKKHEISYKIQA